MRLIEEMGLVIVRDALGDQDVFTYEEYMIGKPGMSMFRALLNYKGLEAFLLKKYRPCYYDYDHRPYMHGHPENGWI